MHTLLAIPVVVLALSLGIDGAMAQSRARIFDVEPGTPISALPLEEFVDPACGTDGGPPSLPLGGFDEFARCPVEGATGLREIWFIYDDEWEYIARAQRDERYILRYSANSFFGQPIITSLLIDDAGVVQGYRVITDPRAPAEVRIEGYTLAGFFKGMFSDAPWVCTDLPRDERERPVEGVLIKHACEMRSDRLLVKIEAHHLFKPGQDLRLNPRRTDQAEGDFESWTRLEVYGSNAVRDAPCCRASALP